MDSKVCQVLEALKYQIKAYIIKYNNERCQYGFNKMMRVQ